MRSLKPFSLIALLCIVMLSAFMNKKTTKKIPGMSVEFIKSKITINVTTCDSIKKYFGEPDGKKFYEQVHYFYQRNRVMSLIINFNDTLVRGNTTVKSYIITAPEGKLYSVGMDEFSPAKN
jgi:hypothetical protein